MAWNEPGGNRGKDPWGGRSNESGPPDLDQVVKKLQEKLGPGGGAGGLAAVLIGLLLLLILAWQSVYIIRPAERGIVLRFGAYADTLMQGPHLRLPPPIERVEVIDVDAVRSIEHKASMLTQDENIVYVELAVQFNIKDAKDFKFNVSDPKLALIQATESAIRAVIGKNTMDYVITEGRADIAARVKDVIQEILDQYATGLMVTSVNIHNASAPEEVKSAFDDAIKAREDEQRAKNEAESYRNDLLPKARGAAARARQDSEAYRQQVIARAEGEANRFGRLLAEYEKAPEVTRQRLYIDAMETVLSNNSKVLVDSKANNSMMYLPLDKLMERREASTTPALTATPAAPLERQAEAPPAIVAPDKDMRGQINARSRGSR
jgi:modulator of FtsH protease HflK